MTAKDVAIAESLVSKIDDATFSKSPVVELSVDPYFESQSFPDVLIQVGFVNTERTMESRNVWHTNNVLLSLLIAGKQAGHEVGSLAAVKDWLAFVDEVIEEVQTVGVAGGTLREIESDERYDPDKLRADNQFRSLFQLTYTTR